MQSIPRISTAGSIPRIDNGLEGSEDVRSYPDMPMVVLHPTSAPL